MEEIKKMSEVNDEKVENKKEQEPTRDWKNLMAGIMMTIATVFGGTSCDRPKWIDIAEQEEDIEAIVDEINLLREERTIAVQEFNELIDKWWTPWYDNAKYKKARSMAYDKAVKYNKQLDKLVKQYHKKSGKLVDKKIKSIRKHKPSQDSKMNEHEYDFTKTYPKKPQ